MGPDESFYRRLVDTSPTGIVAVDRGGVIRFANPWAIRVFGENLIGSLFSENFSEDNRSKCSAFIGELARRSLRDGSAILYAEAIRPDHSPIFLEVRGVNAFEVGGTGAIVLSLVDATAWQSREQELIRRAHYDDLTGLPNRALFADRLRQVTKSGNMGTVAIADVDRFKTLNDSFGHMVGDLVLKEIGQRLVTALPESVTVGRLGGDEFGLILPNVEIDDARGMFERALRELAGTIEVEGHSIELPALSIGMAPLGGRGTEKTLAECDMAMYAAKSRGGNQILAFGEETRAYAGTRRELAERISALNESNAKLYKEARTDQLTGLPNRRAFDETIGAAERPFEAGAILFIDVDQFGSYNHLYGDPAGDAALKTVATALAGVCRQTDVVFRKGGEEFVAVLPDADLEMAKTAANRICSTVAELGIAHAGVNQGLLTVTVGVSCGALGRTVGQCLADASDLVMAAKRSGERNRVHVPK